jgi:hydrogenase 3 maturation protease
VETIKQTIKNWLPDAKRIALLGIGSELRADDAAGVLVAERLENSCRKLAGGPILKVFSGATAPENLTGEIKKFKPTHLIIVDAADTGKKAGEIVLIKPERLRGVSFCTHQLPLKIMVDYLSESIDCRILVIGVQPKSLDFGGLPSQEIQKSVKIISDAIKEVINRQE